MNCMLKLQEDLLSENKCMYRDGTHKNQPNKIGMTQEYFTPSLHLVPSHQPRPVFVTCVHKRIVLPWKAVGWVCSASCCAWRVMLWMAATLLLLSIAEMVCLVCKRW